MALDANPDAGTLGHRLRRETTETIATPLRDRRAIGRYADARAYTSQASSRLEVIAGDDRSEIADTLGITRGAVKSHAHRGMQALRVALHDTVKEGR